MEMLKMMIEAEKLKTYDPSKFKPGYASIKRNGVHAIYDPDMEGFYSRTPKEIHGLEHLIPTLKCSNFPLVGELTIPNIDFETASGKIRSHHSTPEAVFNIFNAIIPNAVFESKYRVLRALKYDYFFDFEKILIEDMTVVKNTEQFDKFYETAIANGDEGVCWIHPHHVYQPGKRTWKWMKRVPMESIEVIVVDILPGTKGKKYEHSMGHMHCQVTKDLTVDVGIFKGQTDEWRQDVYNNKDDYIGASITIEFKDYSKYGKPVQPRFKGFRWDL